MAVPYRETRARFRERARFMGMDTTPLPVMAAAMASLLLVTFSYSSGVDWPLAMRVTVCGAPFFLTVGYLWGFKTNRRPAFDRDLLGLAINGKSESPRLPEHQPVNPFLVKSRRGSRGHSVAPSKPSKGKHVYEPVGRP